MSLKSWAGGLAFLLLFLVACRSQPAAPVVSVKPTEFVAVFTAATPTSPTSAQEAPLLANLYLPAVKQGDEEMATAVPTSTPTATETVTPPPTATPTITPSPTPAYPIYNGPPLSRSQMGLQIHLHREDLPQVMAHLQTLNVGWVKVQVSWKVHQPAPDRYDQDLFWELDQLISAAAANNVAVMIGVAKAPEWSRPTTEHDGPPLDYAHFGAFMSYLANRYRGNVAAYELWNETNLQREWNGAPLNAADFVRLVQVGANAARAADPQAIIISGAPAPTGIHDGVTAVDDRIYFRAMVTAGIADVVDAIGVHPYGWANPPDASAAIFNSPAPSHNNHPSFFFRDTLDDYRAILEQAGYVDAPLWVTEFGWGSFERMGESPPAEAAFMAHVNEWQQAEYVMRAFAMAGERPWLGPMILWNLNFAPTIGPQFSESGYSVLRADGSPRPVYHSLQTIPRLP
jgi:polysaccharide biosynthesis protein PslG